MGKHKPRTLAAFDVETDPFRKGRDVVPFVAGLYDGATFMHWWGADCIEQFVQHLREREDRLLVYAHNGGRFDYLFLLEHLEERLKVISGRIVQARIDRHELRDSFAILPVKLAQAGDKLDFDYKLLRRSVRDRHRPEIVTYLKQDCVALYGAVDAYRARFGNKLTMAGAAIAKLDEAVALDTGRDVGETLQRLTLVTRGDAAGSDPYMRQFFYGGRTEYFERGVLRDAWKVYDVTSMYPDRMAAVQHPTGNKFIRQSALAPDTDFAIIDATSRGALPLRSCNGSLAFPHARAEYYATGHEIRAALDLGLIDVHAVKLALHSPIRTDFRAFVEPYYALRKEADAAGDATGKLHFKLVLNSSYGRFALAPDKLREWRVLPRGFFPPADGGLPWKLAFMGEAVVMWSRLAPEGARWLAVRNVATGASITGAARAVLMRALAGADRPIYCDTDSIICRSLTGVDLGIGLGQWKLETEADTAAIAGKKTYALFARGKPVKWASKGVQLTPHRIKRVAEGKLVRYTAEAPSINLAGVQRPLQREIRPT